LTEFVEYHVHELSGCTDGPTDAYMDRQPVNIKLHITGRSIKADGLKYLIKI